MPFIFYKIGIGIFSFYGRITATTEPENLYNCILLQRPLQFQMMNLIVQKIF